VKSAETKRGSANPPPLFVYERKPSFLRRSGVIKSLFVDFLSEQLQSMHEHAGYLSPAISASRWFNLKRWS